VTRRAKVSFFFEKKEPKKLSHFGYVPITTATSIAKSFLLFLFKKEDLAFLYLLCNNTSMRAMRSNQRNAENNQMRSASER